MENNSLQKYEKQLLIELKDGTALFIPLSQQAALEKKCNKQRYVTINGITINAWSDQIKCFRPVDMNKKNTVISALSPVIQIKLTKRMQEFKEALGREPTLSEIKSMISGTQKE